MKMLKDVKYVKVLLICCMRCYLNQDAHFDYAHNVSVLDVSLGT